MFILGNLLIAIAQISNLLLTLYMYMIIGSALISWVNPDPYNPIVRFLYKATEPVLSKVRSKLPYMGGVDLSPMAVIFAIYFMKSFVVNSVMDMGFRMKAGGF